MPIPGWRVNVTCEETMVQMPGTPESSGPHPAAPPYAAPAAGGPNPPPGGPYWPPPPMPYGPPAYPPCSSSRAPLWIVLAAIAVVLVVGVGAVIGVVLSLPARHAEDPDGAASRTHGADSAVQISRTDTQDLVQGRSEALRRKDLKGFLAALDAGNSELLTGQTRLFHNLRKVSFSESRYEVATQRGRTTDQFGRGVTVSVDVSFVHMIEGYDTKRVAELYRWTVVKKDKNSRPVITAVAGAPSDSLTSESKTQFYPAPWDKWNDIKVVRTEHVLLMADQSMAAQAERYAPIAERAAADDLAAWQASGTSAGLPALRDVAGARQGAARHAVPDDQEEGGHRGRVLHAPAGVQQRRCEVRHRRDPRRDGHQFRVLQAGSPDRPAGDLPARVRPLDGRGAQQVRQPRRAVPGPGKLDPRGIRRVPRQPRRLGRHAAHGTRAPARPQRYVPRPPTVRPDLER